MNIYDSNEGVIWRFRDEDVKREWYFYSRTDALVQADKYMTEHPFPKSGKEFGNCSLYELDLFCFTGRGVDGTRFYLDALPIGVSPLGCRGTKYS